MTPNPMVLKLNEIPEDKYVRETNEKTEIVYLNVVLYSFYHMAALYGLYLAITEAKWQTIIFDYIYLLLSNLGITVGAHRLWTHRTFKAKLPLELILMILNSINCQGTCVNWVRDHRMHHKYSDTNADPHNANRGFFFSHIGWLMTKKHSEVKRLGHTIYMDDINNNPVLRFQKKYAGIVMGSLCFILPTIIPIYFWHETLKIAYFMTMLRFVIGINLGMLVNSFAHKFGTKPYNKSIKPVENLAVSFVTFGEGFHNYHHTFPWDYKTGELGNNWLNISTIVIDLFAKIGWAYDLKTASSEIIAQRVERSNKENYHHLPELIPLT